MSIHSRKAFKFLSACALFIGSASSLFADSRQVSVRVSCTVLPVLEMPAVSQLEKVAQNPAIQNYRVQESMFQKADAKIKTYSITTL